MFELRTCHNDDAWHELFAYKLLQSSVNPATLTITLSLENAECGKQS
jgi:hypothetical protein